MSEVRLREPAYLILSALAGGARHGYRTMQDVAQLSAGRIRLTTGTFYALLDRLRTAGLVEVDREEIVASRLRRYYRLTSAGAQLQAARAGTAADRPADQAADHAPGRTGEQAPPTAGDPAPP